MSFNRSALAALLCSLALGAAQAAPKVLLVVSSEGRDAGKTRPGFELDEFAKAWLTLRASGVEVDVASPAGGAPEADRYNPADDHIQRLKADPQAVAALQRTLRTADVKPGEHAAVLVIGGKGAMFDLPRDAALQRLLTAHVERGGVLAAVCHGPAVLATLTRADGRPLVAQRRMTGFTDEEEATFGKRWAKEFPFLLETRMRELGAVWQEAPLMMPKVVVDGRLITGQNPFSTVPLTQAVLRAVGVTPVAVPAFRDDASLALVERWLAGEREPVRAALRDAAANYKPDLIAMLGYYQFQAATDADQRRRALSIMELGEPHFTHPRLRLAMAEAHVALGQPAAARGLLASVLDDRSGQGEQAVLDKAALMLKALPS